MMVVKEGRKERGGGGYIRIWKPMLDRYIWFGLVCYS